MIQRRTHRLGVTLIELLIVVAVLTILATVALNSVKGLLKDQKVTQASRLVEQYFETAKIRAITTGRPVAVFMDRAAIKGDPAAVAPLPSNYTSTRLSMGEVFPPYSGDVVNAKGSLWDVNFNHRTGTTLPDVRPADGYADQVRFSPSDVFGAFGIPAAVGPVPAGSGFVNVGDRIEFEGVNRKFVIENIDVVANGSGFDFSVTFFNPPEPAVYNSAMVANGYSPASGTYHPAYSVVKPALPLASGVTSSLGTTSASEDANRLTATPGVSTNLAKFRIYRRPTKSLVGSIALPRGTCVDLYASGLGTSGAANDGTALTPFWMVLPAARGFAATDTFTPSSYNRVGVVFDPTGKPTQMFLDEKLDNGTTTVTTFLQYEIDAKLHLLVGRTDQVTETLSRPGPEDSDGILSNLLDPSNSWVSLNPLTGLVTSSPVNSASDVSVAAWTAAPSKPLYEVVVSQARAFASAGVKNASNE